VLVSGWGEAGVDDAPGSIWVVIRELGVVPWQPDRLQSEPRSAFVAQTPELLIHDLDGNLVRDGRWMYYWDAENRLTRVITVAGPSSSFRRVDWKYDARGRRVRQTSYVLSNGVWQVVEDLKFVSDPVLYGWQVAELNATNNSLVRGYVWGLDLSESLDGAGGVGGLLWVQMNTDPAAGTHFVSYDGNGNLWNLVSASTGTETARYEYGPFGEPLRLSGPAARSNPFRFSTKRTEDISGLVLYEYRANSPTSGRWLSRDPLGPGESANLNGIDWNNVSGTVESTRLQAMRPRSPENRPERPRRPPRRPRLPNPAQRAATCAAKCVAEVGLEKVGEWIDLRFLCGKLRRFCEDELRLPTLEELLEGEDVSTGKALQAKCASCMAKCLSPRGNYHVEITLGSGEVTCDHRYDGVLIEFTYEVNVQVGEHVVWGSDERHRPEDRRPQCAPPPPAYTICCTACL